MLLIVLSCLKDPVSSVRKKTQKKPTGVYINVHITENSSPK